MLMKMLESVVVEKYGVTADPVPDACFAKVDGGFSPKYLGGCDK